jgi:hypothetical protein
MQRHLANVAGATFSVAAVSTGSMRGSMGAASDRRFRVLVLRSRLSLFVMACPLPATLGNSDRLQAREDSSSRLKVKLCATIFFATFRCGKSGREGRKQSCGRTNRNNFVAVVVSGASDPGGLESPPPLKKECDKPSVSARLSQLLSLLQLFCQAALAGTLESGFTGYGLENACGLEVVPGAGLSTDRPGVVRAERQGALALLPGIEPRRAEHHGGGAAVGQVPLQCIGPRPPGHQLPAVAEDGQATLRERARQALHCRVVEGVVADEDVEFSGWVRPNHNRPAVLES